MRTGGLDTRGVEGLLGTDWRQAWRELHCVRTEPVDVQVWDGRAREFAENAGVSAYADTFLAYLGLAPGQSVLDMGCGSGTLAIPLARLSHEVFAVDFSQGMLDALQRAAAREGLTTIRPALLDLNTPWSQWEAVGITEDCVDVVFASRSTMVEDIWAAFEKFERAARQKVAVTLVTEFSPRGTKRMGESIAGGLPYLPDFIYAVNVLLQMGRYPRLRYIDCDKTDEQGTLQLVRWAYISWDVQPGKEG
ncbi:MAG: methyltransferase domain-containing protein [Coriobacteriia bacterium]|nr:methyltransferase domain-containing protein [Coriobacteriia bacterium]